VTDWAAWYFEEGPRLKEPSLFAQMVDWYRQNPTKKHPRRLDSSFTREMADRAEQWAWREKWLNASKVQ